jgi:hypothetical protein
LYCPNCGARNDDDATRCANCGNVLPQIRPPTVDVPPQYGPQASVPNYLVPAILTTLFCCLPFGIVSIVYAAQVDSKVAAGDHAGALETSRKARMWAWISFGTGLVIIVFVIVINVIMAVLGADGGSRF